MSALGRKSNFKLDSSKEIPVMKTLGQNLARQHMDQLRPVFFTSPAAPFVPLPDDADDTAIA